MQPQQQNLQTAPVRADQRQTSQSVSTQVIVKLEKNLASLSFFTPSSKRLKGTTSKTIKFTRTVDGKRVEASVTIVPAAIYGLPVTADQDKYIALQKIITDRKQQQGGVVKNPIGFTSAELLRLLKKHRDSGKNYKEISDWLDVMASTTIVSEGVVYFAKQKRRARDRFHVFERAVSIGDELEGGEVADQNYIWLSPWQLENINSNHLLPIDFETYTQLKNHISKALVPLLQIWLFASKEEGSFEKDYLDLCEAFALTTHRYLSHIKRQLGPSLDELQNHGYLRSWRVVPRDTRKRFKVIFEHGERFRPKHAKLPEPSAQIEESGPVSTAAPQNNSSIEDPLIARLGKWGFASQDAAKLLAQLPENQPVSEQLEYWEHVIDQKGIGEQPGQIRRPGGFIYDNLLQNVPVPDHFQSSAKRQAHEQAIQSRRDANEHLHRHYDDYRRNLALDHSQQNQSEYQTLLAAKINTLRRHLGDRRPEEEIQKIARESALDQIARDLPHCKTFEQWRADRLQPAEAAG